MLGDTGSVNLPPSIITDLTTTFFDPAIGWILGIAAIAGYAGSLYLARRRREAAGLEVSPMSGIVLRVALVAAAVIAAIADPQRRPRASRSPR